MKRDFKDVIKKMDTETLQTCQENINVYPTLKTPRLDHIWSTIVVTMLAMFLVVIGAGMWQIFIPFDVFSWQMIIVYVYTAMVFLFLMVYLVYYVQIEQPRNTVRHSIVNVYLSIEKKLGRYVISKGGFEDGQEAGLGGYTKHPEHEQRDRQLYIEAFNSLSPLEQDTYKKSLNIVGWEKTGGILYFKQDIMG